MPDTHITSREFDAFRQQVHEDHAETMSALKDIAADLRIQNSRVGTNEKDIAVLREQVSGTKHRVAPYLSIGALLTAVAEAARHYFSR